MRQLIYLIVLISLSACADIGYYWHSAKGHLSIMQMRVDIDDMIKDPAVDGDLKQRLQQVQQIRYFSINRLHLPDNDSYTKYAQLEHPYVLQNLFAAPELSTQLHSWCYPIIGCANYRGYFEKERLERYVEELRAQNFDVYVGPVAAYSTLGWFDDPVLSSFIGWREYRLAGLIFHELTHQKLYIDDDTQFNESLATAVQQAGTELWLTSKNQIEELEEYHRWLNYREDVVRLIEQTRSQLGELYAGTQSELDKRENKRLIFEAVRLQHDRIARAYSFKGGFSNWFAGELNNAKLASVSAYQIHTRAFIRIIAAFNNDFEAFYDYVTLLGDLDKAQRQMCLQAWQAGNAMDSVSCV